MNIHERNPYDRHLDNEPEADDRWVIPMSVAACVITIAGILAAIFWSTLWGFLIVMTPFTCVGIVVLVLSFR